eukprot:12181409-Alexandrium_andersonii.AAC.1
MSWWRLARSTHGETSDLWPWGKGRHVILHWDGGTSEQSSSSPSVSRISASTRRSVDGMGRGRSAFGMFLSSVSQSRSSSGGS